MPAAGEYTLACIVVAPDLSGIAFAKPKFVLIVVPAQTSAPAVFTTFITLLAASLGSAAIELAAPPKSPKV